MRARIQKISRHAPSIFQGKFDFAYAHARVSLSMEHPFERYTMQALVLVLLALAGGYLYFVSSSVLNVMARREAMAQVSQIQGSIGGAEQRYFELSQAVTVQTGIARGLTPVAKTQYINRPGNVGAATIARNEI